MTTAGKAWHVTAASRSAADGPAPRTRVPGSGAAVGAVACTVARGVARTEASQVTGRRAPTGRCSSMLTTGVTSLDTRSESSDHRTRAR